MLMAQEKDRHDERQDAKSQIIVKERREILVENYFIL